MKFPSKELQFSIILTGVYLAVTAALLPRHEPWGDEAQAWLIARDLNPLEIIQQMGYEGTSALWHFILYPFAQLGAPYVSMQIIALIIAVTAVFLFTRYAPFSNLFKILFASSYWMLYEYAIISRNYGMTVLAFVLVAITYEKRFVKPIYYALAVAFLANTNAQGLFFAFVFGILFGVEALMTKHVKQLAPSLFLMGLAGLIAAYQVGIQPDNFVFSNLTNWEQLPWIARFTFPMFTLFPAPLDYLIPIGIVLTIMSTLLTKPRALFLFIGGIASSMYIFVRYSIEMGGRHGGLIIMLIITSLWISMYEKPLTGKFFKSRPIQYFTSQPIRASAVGMLMLTFVVTTGDSYSYYTLDWYKPYSNSRLMAGYVEEFVPEDIPIAAHHAWRGMALLPYLPDREFYFPSTQSFGTFQVLNNAYKKQERLMDEDARDGRAIFFERIEEDFPETRPVLLLNDPLDNPQDYNYVISKWEIELTHPMLHYERYFLYVPYEYLPEELKPKDPETG